MPADVDAKELSRLLRQYTRGNYGFDALVTQDELDDALSLAPRMLAAL